MVTLAQAKRNVGGTLQIVSKMPGYAWAIPAKECNVGARLRQVAGSTCEGCYAFKGNYARYETSIDKGQYARFAQLENPEWIESMATLINHYCRDGKAKNLRGKYFRWHHSGDIQDIAHLRRIVKVVEATPTVSHWIPTREYLTVAKYRALYGEFPSNLTVRLSAHMVDGDAPSGYSLPTSTVVTDQTETCQATMPQNKSECGSCRACWSSEVKNIAYAKH